MVKNGVQISLGGWGGLPFYRGGFASIGDLTSSSARDKVDRTASPAATTCHGWRQTQREPEWPCVSRPEQREPVRARLTPHSLLSGPRCLTPRYKQHKKKTNEGKIIQRAQGFNQAKIPAPRSLARAVSHTPNKTRTTIHLFIYLFILFL